MFNSALFNFSELGISLKQIIDYSSLLHIASIGVYFALCRALTTRHLQNWSQELSMIILKKNTNATLYDAEQKKTYRPTGI